MKLLPVFLLSLFTASAWAVEPPLVEQEQTLRQTLKVSPENLEARFHLAQNLSWQKRYAEATREYVRLLKSNPDNADFLLGQAQVHVWSGAPDKALPLLRKARRVAPGYEDVWRVHIQASLAAGDAANLRRARVIRDKARASFPKSDWTFAQLDGSAQMPVVVASTVEIKADEKPAASAAVPASPTASVAEPKPEPPLSKSDKKFTLELGATNENLSNGLSNWSSRYVHGQWLLPERQSIFAGFRTTERYALTDRELYLGGVMKLADGVALQLEAGGSETHRVLADHYSAFQFQFEPGGGWVADAGFRRSAFVAGQSRVAQFGVGRYVGNEFLSYTLYEGGPDGSGLSPSHRFAWLHSYGESNTVGMSLTRGSETENTGTTGFLTSKVSGISVSGKHDFSRACAMVWEWSRVQQGVLYTRSGVRLGVRASF